MQILPVHQIFRPEQEGPVRLETVESLLAAVSRKRIIGVAFDPRAGSAVHLVCGARPRCRDHRVRWMFFPFDQQVIPTGGDADPARHAVINDRRHAVHVDEGRATVAAVRVRTVHRRQGNRQVLPVHEVFADRMPPVYRSRCPAVIRAVGVVLVEQVIPALPEDRPVRVIQPVVRGQEVVGRAIRVGRKFHPVQVCGFRVCFGHLSTSLRGRGCD